MTVTKKQNGLIIDYFFRCAEQEQIERGSALIASNSQAAEIYSCIKKALAQLAHVKDECCPDELVDMTMARLKLATANKPRSHKKGS